MIFNKYEYELLFRVLSDRSERGSTIVMKNLPFSKWTELFENTTMVSALAGRLTYRSHVFDMNDPSYRLMSTQGEGSARSSGSRGRHRSSLRDAYFWPLRLKYSFPLAVQILVSTWLNNSLTNCLVETIGPSF